MEGVATSLLRSIPYGGALQASCGAFADEWVKLTHYLVLTRQTVEVCSAGLVCRVYLEGVAGERPFLASPAMPDGVRVEARYFWFAFAGVYYRSFSHIWALLEKPS